MVWKALYRAMHYVPEDKKEEIRRKICEDCRYNTNEEELACCHCQEGSLYEERKIKRKPDFLGEGESDNAQ